MVKSRACGIEAGETNGRWRTKVAYTKESKQFARCSEHPSTDKHSYSVWIDKPSFSWQDFLGNHCESGVFVFVYVHSQRILCRVSIEILPGSFEQWAPQATNEFPFVLVDGHLGIPQKLLYHLYLTAVALYKNADQLTKLTLSSVILLANPAYQTVLNTRKRLIRSGLLRPEEELNFTALSIRGFDQFAKQSIIWDHRRWLFRYQYERNGDAGQGEHAGWRIEETSSFPIIPLPTLEKECQLVRQACELYPGNYHAWAHYHWILDVVKTTAVQKSILPRMDSEDHTHFLRKEVLLLRQWIERHVSDYSAVHLLCRFAALDCTSAPQLTQPGGGTLVDELMEHALSLVLSYPSHETLWLYLRNILSLSTTHVIQDLLYELHRENAPVVAIEKYIVTLVYKESEVHVMI